MLLVPIELVQEEWLKLSITVERTDGGVVDAELIRPRAWVEANHIRAGQLLPLNIAELQVAGFAHVTTIETCPLIASDDGSVTILNHPTAVYNIEVHGEHVDEVDELGLLVLFALT